MRKVTCKNIDDGSMKNYYHLEIILDENKVEPLLDKFTRDELGDLLREKVNKELDLLKNK